MLNTAAQAVEEVALGMIRYMLSLPAFLCDIYKVAS